MSLKKIAETVFLYQMPERVLLRATHFHLAPMNNLHWNSLLRICAGGFKIIIIKQIKNYLNNNKISIHVYMEM